MSNLLTSFIFSIGVATWVYNKFQNKNGGLTQNSLIAAGVIGLMAFIFFLTFIGFISSKFT